MSTILPKSFYDRDPKIVAKDILGKILVKDDLEGIVVETEAYYGAKDPASRACKGKMNFNKLMWSEAGTIFIYMVHSYWMFNVVTGPKPSAILIRALEPNKGIENMIKNRGLSDIKKLTSGPGKLTKSLDIRKEYNGLKVFDKNSLIYVKNNSINPKISKSHRIGVKKDLEDPLRFFILNNKYVSK